jgi:hypothetical protein
MPKGKKDSRPHQSPPKGPPPIEKFGADAKEQEWRIEFFRHGAHLMESLSLLVEAQLKDQNGEE